MLGVLGVIDRGVNACLGIVLPRLRVEIGHSDMSLLINCAFVDENINLGKGSVGRKDRK